MRLSCILCMPVLACSQLASFQGTICLKDSGIHAPQTSSETYSRDSHQESPQNHCSAWRVRASISVSTTSESAALSCGVICVGLIGEIHQESRMEDIMAGVTNRWV